MKTAISTTSTEVAGMTEARKTAIGARLRALRGEQPQRVVADAIGVTTMAISSYERGERVPNDEIKIALARFFGTSVEALFFAD